MDKTGRDQNKGRYVPYDLEIENSSILQRGIKPLISSIKGFILYYFSSPGLYCFLSVFFMSFSLKATFFILLSANKAA